MHVSGLMANLDIFDKGLTVLLYNPRTKELAHIDNIYRSDIKASISVNEDTNFPIGSDVLVLEGAYNTNVDLDSQRVKPLYGSVITVRNTIDVASQLIKNINKLVNEGHKNLPPPEEMIDILQEWLDALYDIVFSMAELIPPTKEVDQNEAI